ncbi:MAG: hypothetical protein FWG79_07655, partial [Bacteroidales bacterium]|nr:hypothetical protein [Bacteroidales bacterium]
MEQYITDDSGVFSPSVFVSGSDVYISYDLMGGSHSKLLKNGVVLYDGGFGYNFMSFFVSGNDVYVAGDDNDGSDTSPPTKAVLLKNGVVQNLTDGT